MNEEKNYVALKPMRFGSQDLQPGDPVPVERGRDYRLMLRLKQIAEVQPGTVAAPQRSSPRPPFHHGDTVVFVAEDGAHAFVTFHEALTALTTPEEVRKGLELPEGAVVASVTFPDDPEPTFVPLASVFPEQPLRQLIEDLTAQGEGTWPLHEGCMLVLVHGDGSHSLVTYMGLGEGGDEPVARVRPLPEEGQGEQPEEQVPLADLLPSVAATRLLAFEQQRMADAAERSLGTSEEHTEAFAKVAARAAFLELLLHAVRAEGQPLPEGFPALDELHKNGVTTFEGLRLLAEGEHGKTNLVALDLIGKGRADRIMAELAKLDPPAPDVTPGTDAQQPSEPPPGDSPALES
ncbi:hypothetical protein [Deinococcus hohokamensis]|uniref:Uncharacterized protein n=1 Tax=Deinococcus hohokamensis TaxID=309883 RepID=A0ABV9I4A7_9DEIO